MPVLVPFSLTPEHITVCLCSHSPFSSFDQLQPAVLSLSSPSPYLSHPSTLDVHRYIIVFFQSELSLSLCALGRDMIWSPRNKRPERLRDNIKEVEVSAYYVFCTFQLVLLLIQTVYVVISQDYHDEDVV